MEDAIGSRFMATTLRASGRRVSMLLGKRPTIFFPLVAGTDIYLEDFRLSIIAFVPVGKMEQKEDSWWQSGRH